MNYKSENHLQKAFIKFLKKDTIDGFQISSFEEEFFYRSGKADIVALDSHKNLFVFELKLFNWKKALNQAYRSTSFAHYCYVVLPESKIRNAMKYKEDFELRNIGLCSFRNSKMEIKIKARKSRPFQKWLTKEAKTFINTNN